MSKRVFPIFLMLMVALPLSSALAQTASVTGSVTDASTGETLPGANVVLQEIMRGATSDMRGNYTIGALPAGEYTLQVSYVGYRRYAQRVMISDGQVVTHNVALAPDFLGLDEVVVTALGQERARQSLTYTVQQVTGAEINESGAPNVLNALQGKVAGVVIRPASGLPGSSAHITIRGSNSLTGNNQPLWVVDGVPVVSGSHFGTGVAGQDGPSRIMDLNPEDIESITVLKGASAAVLYGLRASNGAVVVTTRSGGRAATNRISVNYSSNLTFDDVSVLPDLQSKFGQGSGNAYNRLASTSWGPRIEPGHTAQPIVASDGRTLGNTAASFPATITNAMGVDVASPTTPFENVSPFFQTGTMLTNNIDVRGANQHGNYSVSLGHTTQTGIIPTSGMDRLNLRLGGEYTLSSLFTTGGSVNYTTSKVNPIAKGSNLSNPLFTLYWAPRSYDLWGLPFADPGNPARQINYRGAMDNPRWAVENNEFTDDNDRVFGSVYLNYTPLNWLTVQYRLGTDVYTNRRMNAHEIGSGDTGGRTATPSGGRVDEYSIFSANTTSYLNASATRQLTPDVNLSLLVGSEVNYNKTEWTEINGIGLSMYGFKNVANAATVNGLDELFRTMNLGVYADAQVDFRNMLFLSLTGRNDWNSTLPRANNNFFYPSVGIAFAFTEALGMQNNAILNYGKLKASWAEVGQGGPSYATLPIFAKGSAGSGFITTFTWPYSGQTGFTLGNRIPSQTIVPQNNATIEFGGEFAFLNGRLGLDYTWFKENAKDQIFSVPVPASTGYTTALRNAGELENIGHEVVLRAEPVRTRDFSWDLSVNWAKLTSEVLELAEGVENIFLGGFVAPNIRAQVGSAYPIIFGSRFLRDGDGNIVHYNSPGSWFHGMPIADPVLGPVGNVTPDWTAGIGNTLRFKGFRVHALIDIREGGMAYAGNTRLQKLYGMDAVTEDREAPFVSPGVKGAITGTDADGNAIVRVDGANDIEILRGQNYWQSAMDIIDESQIYDTSFLRLREVTFSYTLPSRLLARTPLSGAQFSITGRNLFLSTDYPNFDPETSLGGASNFQGLEYVNLPGSKSWGFGARLSF